MKSKWMILLSLVVTLAGCTIENGTETETKVFKVNQRDWTWNSIYQRYEYIFDYPELSRGIYEEGTVLGGVFVLEVDHAGKEYEVLKSLPFVESIPHSNGSYTRMISFDIAPGQVTFYIQASDLARSEVDLGTYEFKITLLWEGEN